jgi:hypothetical protein
LRSGLQQAHPLKTSWLAVTTAARVEYRTLVAQTAHVAVEMDVVPPVDVIELV